MKFHIYGQQGLVDLPDSTTVEDLRSLASFNRIIKNYTKMERIENENKRKVYRVENEDEQKGFELLNENLLKSTKNYFFF